MSLKVCISCLSPGAVLAAYDVNSFPMPDAIETYNDANGDTYIVTANEGAVPMILECSPEACPNGPGEFEETELGEEFMVDGKWPWKLPDYFYNADASEPAKYL